MEGVVDAQTFAVRLGYNPVQVRRLVDRMGTDITQNELLSELVKIKGCLDVQKTGCDSSVIEAGRLRHIVIDAANIVSNYGEADCNTLLPIQICVAWFRERGHKEITLFVPSSWKQSYFSRRERDVTLKLEKQANIMCLAEDEESKRSEAQMMKFVVQVDGILVSNDNYTRLVEECPEYAAVVEKRLLMYSFVKNRFMPPDDPLGRMGPTLDKFLRVCCLESTKSSGTKSQSRNPKGGSKGQRNGSPKYVKRTLSRLYTFRCRETALPSELIRSNSDQTIRYCSLPSITESPIIDLFENVSLDTSNTPDSNSNYSSNHRPVIKNISDPTAVKIKDHVDDQVAPPGKFDCSTKHERVQRRYYDDCSNRLSQDAIRWRNQPAERPFEDSRNEVLRNHISVPDISYASIADSYGETRMAGINCYSSVPNFWTNACTELVSYNSDSRYMVNVQSVYAMRAKLHYHLTAIFPREQVDTVFRLHPKEINPRKICSALITLFPKE